MSKTSTTNENLAATLTTALDKHIKSLSNKRAKAALDVTLSEIKLEPVAKTYNYETTWGTGLCDIAKVSDGYIVDGFKLTNKMISLMFDTLKLMSTVGLFEYPDDVDADKYLEQKYNELGTLGFAKFLLNFGGTNLVYCWDEWFDFESIKSNKLGLGYTYYIVKQFNKNKRDEYFILKAGCLVSNVKLWRRGVTCADRDTIVTDTRTLGCDVEEFIDKAYNSMITLVDVLMYNKNKAVA